VPAERGGGIDGDACVARTTTASGGSGRARQASVRAGLLVEFTDVAEMMAVAGTAKWQESVPPRIAVGCRTVSFLRSWQVAFETGGDRPRRSDKDLGTSPDG
jgi:hypothetical protein